MTNTSSVTLGLKFYSDVAGSVTGIRFYKGARNTGVHTGNLWSNTGAMLASVTFSNETATGWQQANFSTPVSIAPNITYTVSYTAPNGGHAQDQSFSWSSLGSGALRVAGTSPGVFAYGSSPMFPSSAWLATNYWVDVVFSPSSSQNSFWPNTAAPATPQVANTAAVSVGLKFYSEAPGSVRGVRFYKGPGNTGSHVGSLWSASGTRIASVTFAGETASGWQQANFSTPINISANTVYVVSYTAPRGAHAHDANYAWTNLSSSPLRVSGSAPGVFTYGSGTQFPREAYLNSNYWVDVVFAAAGGTTPQPPTTYSISGNVQGATATVTLSGPVSRSASSDPVSGSFNFTGLPNGVYVAAPSSAGHSFTPVTRSVTVNNATVTGVSFTATALPPPVQRTVTLSWNPSDSQNVAGYHVYRADIAGGSYSKITAAPVAATSYVDNSVVSGRTYYYVATTMDRASLESSFSSQAIAVVPAP